MESYFLDWANLLLRWAHVVTVIAWIGASFYFVFLDLSLKLGNPFRAAGAPQFAIGINGDAAGVVSSVFQTLEAFKKNRGDVPLRHSANNSAHR